MRTEIWAMVLVIIASFVGALGPIYFKKGSKDFGLNISKLMKNYNLMIGVFLYGVATIIFIPALKGGELSVLYPLVSLTYIWVSLLSIKLLGEKMNRLKWIGIVLIMLGVTFIGIGS